MISKSHRFHGRNSLNRTYRLGKTVRTQNIALKFAPNQRRSQWRAAVVVAKKVHKSAVVRNRIRRRIFAQLRAIMPQDAPTHDLVFTVFSEDVLAMPPDQLQNSITQLLGQATILPPKTRQTTGATHDMIEGKE